MASRISHLGVALGLLAVGGGAVSACSSSGDAQPQIPLAAVNEVLFLTDQQNSNLRFDNGAVYVKGGVRGIVVVRQNASTYLAFERNCPYQPLDTCARVKIEPFLRLFDPCCNSQFSLQGQPQGGPAARPLRQYRTALSGNTLTITN
ncbi:Rieske (2Fe-2S) protein [Hymenobacter sp. 102]|uniref:Rieske (2Fe-2S) protein n=1 Tax=Hymenobacter sp. 102 TaxID=3403152 RepID=UPI003CEA5C04